MTRWPIPSWYAIASRFLAVEIRVFLRWHYITIIGLALLSRLPVNAYLANPALLLFPLSSSCSTHYIIELEEFVPFRWTGIIAHRTIKWTKKCGSFDVSHASSGYSAVIIVVLIGNSDSQARHSLQPLFIAVAIFQRYAMASAASSSVDKNNQSETIDSWFTVDLFNLICRVRSRARPSLIGLNRH